MNEPTPLELSAIDLTEEDLSVEALEGSTALGSVSCGGCVSCPGATFFTVGCL